MNEKIAYKSNFDAQASAKVDFLLYIYKPFKKRLKRRTLNSPYMIDIGHT